MIIATIFEKRYGTEFVSDNVYSSIVFITLWGIAGVSSLMYIFNKKLYKKTFTFIIHIAFAVILAGAFVTHLTGEQGYIHLRKDSSGTDMFNTFDDKTINLPFYLKLEDFTVKSYPGTQSPMDYISKVTITDCDTSIEGSISMNKILEYRNYRFYQSGFDQDKNGTTLSVYHDPYGIAITYTGYCLLFAGIVMFFIESHSNFRKLLKSKYIRRTNILIILFIASHSTLWAKTEKPQTVPTVIAETLGDLNIYYNGRICPLQTLAVDFTNKVYGKRSYKGLTAEEVLAGCFFYYDKWKEEPFIRIKSRYVQSVLGTDEYACISDFVDIHGYKIEKALQKTEDAAQRRALEEANEKFNITSMLCTGNLLKIFPVKDSAGNTCQWYSVSEKLPEEIPHEKWMFLKYSMNYVSENIYKKDFANAEKTILKIKEYQEKEAGEGIPGEFRFEAEKIYNSWSRIRLSAMVCLTIGICGFIYQSALVRKKRSHDTPANKVMKVGLYIFAAYILSVIIMRGIISGRFPIANGFETMLFMAATCFLLTIMFSKHLPGFTSFGYLTGGLALLVAMLGESNPAITPLMPVLSSPLLSIHVMTIMVSYSLFAIMMLNGITAEMLQHTDNGMSEEIKRLEIISRILLYPAVFLLAAGIFIGAIWANVSWGRYWGWDPKEVWALITMLIYSSALHTESLKIFSNTRFFHRFTVIAFLSVIITYFGVNFILGGMHSYA